MIDLVLEEIERALHLLTVNSLPAILDDVTTQAATDDAAYYAALSLPVPDIELSYPVTILDGHHPYVLEAPVDAFPIVTCVAYEHPNGAAEVDIDQGAGIMTTAYVEAFNGLVVPRGKDFRPYEDVLNLVSKRYGKALHRMVLGSGDLLGTVFRIDTSPQVNQSNIAALEASDLDDKVFLTQGVRLEYTFTTVQSPWE